MEPISIIGFLHEIKMVPDINKVHKAAAMWFFRFFMKQTADEVLTARFSFKSRFLQGIVKEGMLTYYVQVVNHLLETYGTDEIIAEASTRVVRLTQRAQMSPLQQEDDLLMKSLRCPRGHDEFVLMRPLVEGLLSLKWHDMSSL